MTKLLLLVGTKKGLFTYATTDRTRWELAGPFLSGKEVNHAIYDGRTGKIHATANDAWFGSEITASTDLGATWQSATQNPSFPEESGLKLERIWHLEPGPTTEPQVLYAGVAPAALFRSQDGGQTFQEMVGLTQHPSRPHWNPGAGGLCLHSIALDRNHAGRIYVGISAAGVFRSDDNGTTWRPVNRGTRAEFMPDKYPEFGQCVHKLLLAPGSGSVLFQQNHCGVYRSADGGEQWQEITPGLPSDFGFPLAIHPREPETIYVLPLQGAEFRCPPDNKLRVFRSRNGGQTWEPLSAGLPQDRSFLGVYREGMTRDELSPAGIYFGTNTGKIFGSSNDGDSWQLVADNLPPIYSLSISAVR